MHVHEGFKPPSLVKFDDLSDPYEHVTSINTHMIIIGASDSLKWKLLSGTSKDTTFMVYRST